ncbi:MAG: DUF1592 domain-containing protein [Planctomycetota bacterium]|nr:DUF1592 domain-containing protein [Planctomycetota bacterium]
MKQFSRKTTAAFVAIAIVLIAAVIVLQWYRNSEIDVRGPMASAWRSHTRTVLNDPSISRYYNFQDIAPERGLFRDQVGWRTALAIAPSTMPEPPFRMTEGHWPEKRAVSVDQFPLEAKPIIVDGTFSVSTWIRHHGPGMIPGGNTEAAGTLLAIGDGVWSGWRLIMLYPCNSLVFEIGRPKPDPPIGVASLSRVPPEVWTHVVCTWDGKHIRLYVNGLLSGTTPYSGEFHQVKSHSKLRVGYVGNGLGSVRFDIDELAIYDRCLSATDALSTAWWQCEIPSQTIADFDAAGRLLGDGELDDALGIYQQIAASSVAIPEIHALATIRCAECLREQHKYDEAVLVLSEVTERNDISDTCRRTAIHEAIAMREGVTTEHYRPVQEQMQIRGIDFYKLCQSCTEYDRTIDAFRQARAKLDADRWMQKFENEIQPLLAERCFKCHGANSHKTDLDLTQFTDGEKAGEVSELWTTVLTRVRAGEMPPPGHSSLSEDQKRLLIKWIESRPVSAFCEELATEENQRYFPGHVLSRRLTQMEFRNAIRDLLGETVRPDELPPADGSGGEGFDNVGDVLFTSISHVESYLKSSGEVIRRTINRERQLESPGEILLLTVFPKSLNDTSELTDAQAASKIITTFARRAWRRPIESQETERLMELFSRASLRENEFLEAIAVPLQAILLSPHFLYVVEPETSGTEVQRLTSHQFAMRLALFLWSSIPDDELRQVADSGSILDNTVLHQQLQRMLRDPKAQALGESFGLQWLGLNGVSDRVPDPDLFPEYNSELGHDMRQEASLFVNHIFQNNRPIDELIDADYVIVNERLSKHYDLARPKADWGISHINDQRRGGVLTMGGVLTASSRARRTSPVLRGQWILHQVLGSYVAAPPPGIPSLEETDQTGQHLTIRQQMERHRSQPECAACHQTMDPLGFCLENYDPVGRWRDFDTGIPVDASGQLPTGEAVAGPQGLKRAILDRREEFHRHFVRKLLGFALGRGLDRFDECVVEHCLKKLSESDFRAEILVETICRSYAFQYRYFKP